MVTFKLLVTIRADFMSQALDCSLFAGALNAGHKEILAPMNADELRAAIEKPAAKHGVKFESGLVRRILEDVQREPGSLPLLQFALSKMWERQRHRMLTHKAYEDSGEVKRALARHADAVLERRSPEEQANLRKIFIQLVRPGQGTEDTRQSAVRDQFSPENWDLITQTLAHDRLVITGRNEETGRETVEIVHEALIRHWQPLRNWINQDRKFRIWQNELRQAVRTWEQTDKDDGALLRGVRLGDAEEKLNERKDELSPQEVAFIEAGVALREKEVRDRERARKEKERLKQRFWRMALAGLIALLVVMGAWVAREIVQGQKLTKSLTATELAWKETDKLKEEALANEQEANERLLDAEHNLGIVFSEKADKAFAEKKYNEARLYALHALARLDPNRGDYVRAKTMGDVISQPVYPMIFSSPIPTHHDRPIKVVCFSPDGKTVASCSDDKSIRLWDVEKGNAKHLLIGHQEAINSVNFSPDGKTLASGSDDSTIRL